MHIKNSILIAAALLPACVGSGNLQPPQQLENSSWSHYLSKTDLIGKQQIEARWWLSYQDEMLNQLVASALNDNLSLKIARSRIREARASRQAELSVMRPQLGLNSSVTEQRLSENGSLPVGRIAGFEIEQTIYQAGFDTSWEIDLFGRNPKRHAIANARFQNELELQQDLHLSIAAEVAKSYIQLRNTQAQMQITLEVTQRQQRIVETVQILQEHGEVSAVEVLQAQVLLAGYQARSPAQEALIRGLIYQISVLTGKAPDALSASLLSNGTMPTSIANNLQSVSSNLLRRRADVRNAERRYVIAGKQQELAKLAIFPTFSLFGRVGPNTVDFDNFLESESLALDLGGLIHWPLYNGGRLRAQSKIAEERTRQAEYQYTNVVLTALQEVETVSARYIEARKELTARGDEDAARRSIADNIRQKYEAGAGDLVSWLTAEQLSGQSQLQAIAAHAQFLQHSIALHKALGGGWELFDKESGLSR